MFNKILHPTKRFLPLPPQYKLLTILALQLKNPRGCTLLHWVFVAQLAPLPHLRSSQQRPCLGVNSYLEQVGRSAATSVPAMRADGRKRIYPPRRRKKNSARHVWSVCRL